MPKAATAKKVKKVKKATAATGKPRGLAMRTIEVIVSKTSFDISQPLDRNSNNVLSYSILSRSPSLAASKAITKACHQWEIAPAKTAKDATKLYVAITDNTGKIVAAWTAYRMKTPVARLSDYRLQNGMLYENNLLPLPIGMFGVKRALKPRAKTIASRSKAKTVVKRVGGGVKKPKSEAAKKKKKVAKKAGAKKVVAKAKQTVAAAAKKKKPTATAAKKKKPTATAAKKKKATKA